MKKSILTILGVCMASLPLYAQQEEPSRIEKKNFSDVNEIRFDHYYGHITVTESDAGQVKLEIRYFDSDKIKPVSETSVTGGVLTVKTVIDFPRNFNNRHKIGIDYLITVPKDAATDIRLKYGNIHLGDRHGPFKCDLAYGDLHVNTLFKSPVSIASSYSNLHIGRVDTLDLSTAYGSLNIGAVQSLKINSQYTKCHIENVDLLKAASAYGSLQIGSAIEFDAGLRFTPVTIDRLEKSLNLACDHSTVQVLNTSPGVQSVTFDGSFSNFELGLDAGLSAHLDVDLKYTGLSVEDLYVKYSFSETDHSRVIKKGVIGNKTPAATIRIGNTHASVKIHESSWKVPMQKTVPPPSGR
ncbi:MAG: DUF4097 family beta strand repeat-containing protein [Tannerella sp.]|jgi:hypothetical protein|nr:DUF4097 family beta strand repeat-containing protein [Tannerella sp.]